MKKNAFQRKISSLILVISLVFLSMVSGCQKNNPPARDIIMNPLFTDNMLLQRNQDIIIWGTAEPGGEVLVVFNEQQGKSIVDNNGKWKVTLSPIPEGGPYKLTVSGEKTHTINNVLMGEVWICSGQSNMEMSVNGKWGKVINSEEEAANANYPNIRLLMVKKYVENSPQENFESEGWKECSSESISDFSAAAYFFGRDLHNELDIPIGLIQAAWGGTIIEAWTSGPSLKKIPEFTDIVKSIESDTTTYEESLIIVQKKKEEWPPKVEKILDDRGIFNHGFQNPDYNTNDWKTMKLPTVWEALNINVDGVVWFSKDINVPKLWKGEDLTLCLGKINDYDNTWFNGKRVGRGTDVGDLRVYKIPDSLVKLGQNRIIVQVLDVGNNGGLYGPAEKMKLFGKNDSISLVGNWKYKIDPIKIEGKDIPEKQNPADRINRSTVLYNAMINPLLPYGMKGVIWTQGASNAERAYQYRTLFKTMINDWRNLWGQGDFPFLYVQLANWQAVKSHPVEDEWAELREAQAMALELPNTGMVVAIDIGEEIDIHPRNKQDVGKRLALIAKAKVYGKDIPYSGPIYKSMKIEGNKIRMQFEYTDTGLKIKGSNNLKGFAIAGKDKKFVWAKAKIEGDEVVVWNTNIKDPVAVRYAWDINPDCNLYNGANLPTVPFRTDDWEGLTYGKK